MKFLYMSAFVLASCLSAYAADQDTELQEKQVAMLRIQQEINDRTVFLEEMNKAEEKGETIPASLKEHYKNSIKSLTNLNKKIENYKFVDVKDELFAFDQNYNLFSERFYQQA